MVTVSRVMVIESRELDGLVAANLLWVAFMGLYGSREELNLWGNRCAKDWEVLAFHVLSRSKVSIVAEKQCSKKNG